MAAVSRTQRIDALVIGGGPAGATAAALLASWGRSVVVVHRESSQPDLAESLPASTRKLLRFLGQLDAVEAAGFHPNHGNLSRWAGKSAVATSADPGYHVSRRELDRRLREHARSQGAHIVEGLVRAVDLREPIEIRVAGSDGSQSGLSSYSAEFVLDCSGRAGVVARRGLRRFDAGYRTLAVAAEWVCDDWPVEERMHTIVDSYADGWAWSVPLSATRRHCTVMIDRDRTTMTRASLARVYRAELEKAKGIDERLRRARQVGPPWACDATVYGAVRAADGRALLVGDAASFIEPLSSAGVKKALASAWRAAVVVNTCLDEPGMLSVAGDLHDHREQQVYFDCRRRSAAFFEEAARFHDDRFWASRARSSFEGAGPAVGDLDERGLATDASIRRAFERLRDAPAARVFPGPALRLDMTAVIEGRAIVMREGVVIPGIESPVRFAAGVNLPELIRVAAGCSDLARVIDAYRSQFGSVDPNAVLTGLSVLVARGLLQISEGSAFPGPSNVVSGQA
jgi:flavin-dependent dehydrogenase